MSAGEGHEGAACVTEADQGRERQVVEDLEEDFDGESGEAVDEGHHGLGGWRGRGKE